MRIIEVGARKPLSREFTREPFYSLPGAEVLSFEADKVEADRLQAIAPPHIKVLPIGLGSANEQRPFYVTTNPKCSSLYEPNEPLLTELGIDAARLESKMLIKTRTLDAVLDEQGWPGFDFIKADVQGAELDIIKGADRSVRGAAVAVLEACLRPIYNGQPLFGDLCAHMASVGFEFHHFVQIGGVAGQQLWVDALFVNPAADPAKLKVLTALYPLPQESKPRTSMRGRIRKLLLRH